MSDDQNPVETGTGLGLTVRRPPSLQRLDSPTAELILAVPEPGDGRFRTNLVVTVEPSDATIERLSTETMAAALATNPETVLLACDLVVFHPLAPGRRIEFAYLAGECAVCVTQWLFLAQGHAVCATASRAVDQVLGSDSTFDYVVDSLRLPGGGS